MTLATAAKLDSEQRPVTGTTSSDISVQLAMRSGNSKMQTDQIEAISEFERSGDTLNLQASSSPPPSASPAAPPTRILELSPAIASLALSPSFDLSPIGVSNGVPTPQPARIVIGFPSIVLNPISISNGFPSIPPISFASSSPTLAPYPVSVPNDSPTIAFGILNVIQVRLD